MFNPSREQVRQFFMDTWRKHQQDELLTPLEAMALDWIIEHPEYHAVLMDEGATQADYLPEGGQTNPFLHLSMHLAIAEQLSIDQPPGIKAAYQRLVARTDAHQAAHQLMEALGQIVWEAQRERRAPDSEKYLELIRRAAG